MICWTCIIISQISYFTQGSGGEVLQWARLCVYLSFW